MKPTKDPLVPIQVEVVVPSDPSEGKPSTKPLINTRIQDTTSHALSSKVNREQIRKESGHVVASRQSAKAPERSGQSRSHVAPKATNS